MRKFLGLAILLTVAACDNNSLPAGGGDGGAHKDGAAGAADLTMSGAADLTMSVTPDDLSGPGDMTYYVPDSGGVSCGMSTCAVGQVCCATPSAGSFQFACAASCPMDGGTVTLACSGPQDCSGNPCCAPVGSSGGSPSFSGAMCTAAQTDCVPTFDLQKMTGQTRLCRIDQDCVQGAPSSMFPDCCTAMDKQGNKEHVCFAKAYLGFTGGAITCP